MHSTQQEGRKAGTGAVEARGRGRLGVGAAVAGASGHWGYAFRGQTHRKGPLQPQDAILINLDQTSAGSGNGVFYRRFLVTFWPWDATLLSA